MSLYFVKNSCVRLFSCLFLLFIAVVKVDAQDAISIGDNFPGEPLPVTEIDMGGCVSLFFKEGSVVIKDKNALDSLVRSDGGRKRCLKHIEKFDLEKHAFIGVNLNTGYCRRPEGLSVALRKVEAEKEYVFIVSYLYTQLTCRALSSYNLWVEAPTIPDGYTVKYVLNPIRQDE